MIDLKARIVYAAIALALILSLVATAIVPAGPAMAAVPSAPTLISPDDGATVNGISITFQWNPSISATKYYLDINTDPAFGSSTRMFYSDVGDRTQYTVTGFSNNGSTYYWRVNAGNSNGLASKADSITNSRSFINRAAPIPTPSPIWIGIGFIYVVAFGLVTLLIIRLIQRRKRLH